MRPRIAEKCPVSLEFNTETAKIREWQIVAIRKGVEQADCEQFVDHETLKARWMKRLADAIDETR